MSSGETESLEVASVSHLSAGASHAGPRRRENEDRFSARPAPRPLRRRGRDGRARPLRSRRADSRISSSSMLLSEYRRYHLTHKRMTSGALCRHVKARGTLSSRPSRGIRGRAASEGIRLAQARHHPGIPGASCPEETNHRPRRIHGGRAGALTVPAASRFTSARDPVTLRVVNIRP